MKTEVEIRGPLTMVEYKRLLVFLKKHGKLTKTAWQMVIFFKVKKDNLSLKKDHGQEKIVLKFGDWQKGSRKEVEVYLEPGQFDNALSLLKGLGFNQGHKAPAFRQDFSHRGVQISLKTKCVIGPHFEMEVSVTNTKDVDKQKERLIQLAQGLKLRVWTEAEYRTHTHNAWEAHHQGPEDL